MLKSLDKQGTNTNGRNLWKSSNNAAKDQWEEEEGLEAHFAPEEYDFLPTKEERFFE